MTEQPDMNSITNPLLVFIAMIMFAASGALVGMKAYGRATTLFGWGLIILVLLAKRVMTQ